MITLSKKARLSLQVLMFGATLLSGVSAFAMDQKEARLDDQAFRSEFADAVGFCMDYPEIQGPKYASKEKCASFLNMLRQMYKETPASIYKNTNEIKHVSALVYHDYMASEWAKNGDEISEFNRRLQLAQAEKRANEAGFGYLVKPETLEEKNRMAYLEYKQKVRANNEEAKSNSNNNAQ